MARKRKPESEQLVNVGLKVSAETKQFLLEEAAAAGVAEGTLARRYVLLGMRAAQQGNASFNSVVSQIIDLLNSCSVSTQLDVLAIVRALKDRQDEKSQLTSGARRRPPADVDPADIGQELEIIAQIGQG